MPYHSNNDDNRYLESEGLPSFYERVMEYMVSNRWDPPYRQFNHLGKVKLVVMYGSSTD